MHQYPTPGGQRLRYKGVGELEGGEAEGGFVYYDVHYSLDFSRPTYLEKHKYTLLDQGNKTAQKFKKKGKNEFKGFYDEFFYLFLLFKRKKRSDLCDIFRFVLFILNSNVCLLSFYINYIFFLYLLFSFPDSGCRQNMSYS